ncbi:hypothetical protein IW16_14875 [Chryseobacterium vrystaatense]|nr:hypothetical protein IW16_14875 [Chryseobacterium vrystaatense]
MKAYYYFLFRIYRYYIDNQNENEFQAVFSATAVSTAVLSIAIISFLGVLDFLDILSIPSKKYIIFGMILLGIFNHFFFVREKKWVDYDFEKDKKGGFKIIICILFLFLFVLIGGSFNRKKIFEERRRNPSIEVERRSSLESEIRKWFEEKF